MTNALAKLDKATQMLAEAKSLDEVKHIMDIAEAARVYARAAKLGLEAQNHAAEICLISKRKAGEFLTQLERPPVGRPEKLSMRGEFSFTEAIEDAGITKQDAYRWQQIAEIPEIKFRDFVNETKESGRELTQAAALSLAKGKPHISNNAGENEWYTPPVYIAAALAVMGRIDIDPASSEIANKTVKASLYYTKNNDGLDKVWAGKVWMNPPYSSELIKQFISKYASHVVSKEISEGIVLVNNATETVWCNELVSVSSAVMFPSSRVKFLDPHGNEGAPLQGQLVAYAGKNVDKFIKEFGGFGWTAKL